MSILPPFWMRVGVTKSARGRFRIWLPLWLLWPVWLLVLFLFLLTALVATLATGSFAFASAIAATRELHRVAAALRGADCEVQAHGKHYSLSFV